MVDNDPVLIAQAAIWLTCLRRRQHVPAQDIFVHVTQLANAEFLDWVRAQGVNLVEIERFHPQAPHCNKIMQLATFTDCGYDQIVLMDCDTAWLGDRAMPRGMPVAAVAVHEPNPPFSVLADIFAAAGLGAPEPSAAFFPLFDAAPTDWNNCNGGLYIVSRDFVPTLARHWRRSAEWLLQHLELQRAPDWAYHTDQISFAMALRAAGVRVQHLDLVWNFPTNAPDGQSPDVTPQILHYHRRFAADGQIKTVGRPQVDAAIGSLNGLIGLLQRDPGLARIFRDLKAALGADMPPAETPPTLISTIVLNWNRAPLLRQCLRSYAETVTGPAEIVVVDNGSTDASRAVIEDARAILPSLRAVLLDRNIGGEAVNRCLELVEGELIHISENDQLFLPGWANHVREAFARFPQLGRLSLFSPVPTDREAWHAKPARLRFATGKILYEAEGYPGTSSIVRGELVRRYGLRLYNREPSLDTGFRFPNDARLNEDVKRAGFWNAWSDRYYVRNLGHELDEFSRDLDYYERNALAKPGFGAEGWQRNMAEALARPPVRRGSTIFTELENMQPAIAPAAPGDKPGRLWSMFDTVTPEVEVLDFLHALARMVKPQRIVATGAWLGHSAVAFAVATRDNGFGHVDAVEPNPEAADAAERHVAEAELAAFATIHRGRDLGVLVAHRYEMALFSSDAVQQTEEFHFLYDQLEPGAVVVFVDVGAQQSDARDRVRDLITMGMLEGSFFPTPRGVFIGRTIKPARPQPGGVLRMLPPEFSEENYLGFNPDIAMAGVDPAEHYRQYGWAERRQVTADWSLTGIRLILMVTSGRSGTRYLSNLLGAVPGVWAAHEPTPNFAEAMRPAQRDRAAARRFWEFEKLPAIRNCGQPVYVETSHLACKGFIEPLIQHGQVPDLILLRRSPYLVATSYWSLDAIPGRTALGERFLLQPDDPGVLPLEGWQELPDWALCFWYCREIERRMEVYGRLVRERGGRVLETSLRALQSEPGARELLAFLDADEALLGDPEFMRRQSEPVNQKLEAKARAGKPLLSGPEMLELARIVDARLQHAEARPATEMAAA